MRIESRTRMSRLVKIDFIAELMSRGLEHVAEQILLMINRPPDISNSQLVSKSVIYRVAHHVSDLGWVDLDLDKPLILLSCAAYSAYLSSAQAESTKIKVNPET